MFTMESIHGSRNKGVEAGGPLTMVAKDPVEDCVLSSLEHWVLLS